MNYNMPTNVKHHSGASDMLFGAGSPKIELYTVENAPETNDGSGTYGSYF